MYRKLFTVPPRAWTLVAAIAVIAIASAIMRTTGLVSPQTFLFTLQPILAIAVAAIAFTFVRGKQDRVKHKTEKAVIVGCIVAIWFVFYFLSGLSVTYVHNSLVTDFRGLALNMLAYGVVAVAIEYTRYAIMLLGGRRNVVWFGSVVAVVFSLQQMNLTQLSEIATLDALIKVIVADFVPSIVASFLLTYLAFTSGLRSMLVYRLGVIAVTIFPPIIPKYDWYLVGVSSILLTLSVYIAIDRSSQGSEPKRKRHHFQYMTRAYDLMLLIVMVGMVMFMTGFFTYKPSAIVSNSMKPIFSRGSMVVLERTSDAMDISIGDIVQYESSGKVITHRVTKIDSADDGSGKRVYTTKGDNNPSDDPLVSEPQILGIIRAQVPFIGYPTVWLKEISV